MKLMFLSIGTTIGAGDASGREVWELFGNECGLVNLLFVLFFIISSCVIMEISFDKQSTQYRPVLLAIVGKKLTAVYDVMIFLYLYTTTVVMLSGSGATGQAFNVSYWWGVGIMMIALIVLFAYDISGLLS